MKKKDKCSCGKCLDCKLEIKVTSFVTSSDVRVTLSDGGYTWVG